MRVFHDAQPGWPLPFDRCRDRIVRQRRAGVHVQIASAPHLCRARLVEATAVAFVLRGVGMGRCEARELRVLGDVLHRDSSPDEDVGGARGLGACRSQYRHSHWWPWRRRGVLT